MLCILVIVMVNVDSNEPVTFLANTVLVPSCYTLGIEEDELFHASIVRNYSNRER